MAYSEQDSIRIRQMEAERRRNRTIVSSRDQGLETYDNQRKILLGVLIGSICWETLHKLKLHRSISFLIPAILLTIRELQYQRAKEKEYKPPRDTTPNIR